MEMLSGTWCVASNNIDFSLWKVDGRGKGRPALGVPLVTLAVERQKTNIPSAKKDSNIEIGC
eukprot:2000389-Ditylum_brightwellii.AAC.2